jgi:hypothetical protein
MMASKAITATQPRSELVTLAERDFVEVAQFVARESGKDPVPVEAHLRWFVLENPAREAGTPLGWGLRGGGGELAGCLLCSPQAFRFQQQRVLVMGSTCFYVDAAHRGSGALIFLKYSRLNDRWALFGNSANADAAKLWKSRGASPISDSEHEVLGVVRWSPVLEDIIARKFGTVAVPRWTGPMAAALASPFRGLTLVSDESAHLYPLKSVEEAAALAIFDAPSQLTCARDIPYLRWRYFSGRDSTVALFAFRNRPIDRPVLVAVNQRPRGRRGQINTLNLLDVYPPVDPEIHVQIVSELLARYRGQIDMIGLRCLDPHRQKLFCKAGFLKRKFDAPNGWFLDKNNLLPTRDWYVVPGDGDWIS